MRGTGAAACSRPNISGEFRLQLPWRGERQGAVYFRKLVEPSHDPRSGVLPRIGPSITFPHGTVGEEQQHRIYVFTLAVAHLVVDVGSRRMPGAAKVAQLLALIEHLAHARCDALQMTVKMGPAVDVLGDHGVAVAA